MTLPFQRISPDSEVIKAIPEATGDIIAFILERFHAVHREQLPGLIELARKVEKENASRAHFPQGVPAWVESAAESLESHMQKEERILFPMMLAGGHPMISAPISVMRAEHEDHEANLAALAALTKSLELPAGASPDWCALYAGLAKLASDLAEHIYTENEVLFPRFGA